MPLRFDHKGLATVSSLWSASSCRSHRAGSAPLRRESDVSLVRAATSVGARGCGERSRGGVVAWCRTQVSSAPQRPSATIASRRARPRSVSA